MFSDLYGLNPCSKRYFKKSLAHMISQTAVLLTLITVKRSSEGIKNDE